MEFREFLVESQEVSLAQVPQEQAHRQVRARPVVVLQVAVPQVLVLVQQVLVQVRQEVVPQVPLLAAIW